MLEIIEQYIKNEKEIEKLQNDLRNEEERKNNKIYELRYSIYSDKINALEKERDEKIININQHFEEMHEKPTNQKIEKLSDVVNQVNKILALIEIARDGDKSIKFEVYCYIDGRKVSVKPIDTLYKDEFADIGVFIERNRKPKNCFSLFIAGNTIFNETILDLSKNYLGFINDNYVTYSYILKDNHIKEELLNYYEKNKEKLRTAFLEKYDPVKKEYLAAVKLNENKEWIKLFLEKKKEYYENHCSRGEELEEYKEIIKELKHIEK